MEATESIFTTTFGSSPYVKVLGFFITFDRFDYSKSQVANEVGISRVTIENIWKDLVSRGFIAKSRDIGMAELYHLNTKSPIVKALQKTSMQLASAYADAEQHTNVRGKMAARASI